MAGKTENSHATAISISEVQEDCEDNAVTTAATHVQQNQQDEREVSKLHKEYERLAKVYTDLRAGVGIQENVEMKKDVTSFLGRIDGCSAIVGTLSLLSIFTPLAAGPVDKVVRGSYRFAAFVLGGFVATKSDKMTDTFNKSLTDIGDESLQAEGQGEANELVTSMSYMVGLCKDSKPYTATEIDALTRQVSVKQGSKFLGILSYRIGKLRTEKQEKVEAESVRLINLVNLFCKLHAARRMMLVYFLMIIKDSTSDLRHMEDAISTIFHSDEDNIRTTLAFLENPEYGDATVMALFDPSNFPDLFAILSFFGVKYQDLSYLTNELWSLRAFGDQSGVRIAEPTSRDDVSRQGTTPDGIARLDDGKRWTFAHRTDRFANIRFLKVNSDTKDNIFTICSVGESKTGTRIGTPKYWIHERKSNTVTSKVISEPEVRKEVPETEWKLVLLGEGALVIIPNSNKSQYVEQKTPLAIYSKYLYVQTGTPDMKSGFWEMRIIF